MTTSIGGSRAIVWLDRIAANLTAARSLLPAGVKVFGVVKANAYGHGALPVARALQRAGVCGVAVDDVTEGAALRAGGIRVPILVLNPLCADEADALVNSGLTATIADPTAAQALDTAARRGGSPIAVHLRVRSGGSGLGASHRSAAGLVALVTDLNGLRVEGLYTQMVGTYRDDPEQIRREIAEFSALVADLTARGLRPPMVHAVTSPGLLNARAAAFDMVRLGAVLYGIRMNPAGGEVFPFRPAMQVMSRIAFLSEQEPGSDVGYGGAARLERGRRVAMIPVGYADMPYLLRFRDTAVLIRGRRAPLIGEAFMGMVLADVTAIADAGQGDTVTFVGAQDHDTITVEDIGRWNAIRPSAVLMLGPRVTRVYEGEGA